MTNRPSPTRRKHNTPTLQSQNRQQGKQQKDSTLNYGDLLRQTGTGLDEMASTMTDDYGVKSLNCEMLLTTTSQVTLSSTTPTIQQQQQLDASSSCNNQHLTHTQKHITGTTVPGTQSSLWLTAAAYDQTNSDDDDENNGFDHNDDDDDDDDDDSFSYFTDDTTQQRPNNRPDDSKIIWQAGENDLVVPKMNMPSNPRYLNSNHTTDGLLLVDSGKSDNHPVGHLSIMICGDSGIGKTSLIQAFGVVPEISGHISPASKTIDQSKDNMDSIVMDGSTFGGEKNVSAEIKEWYASTMRQSQRNNTSSLYQSHKDIDLCDKNICFIDTPGYGTFVDAKTVIQSTTRYLERQFQQTDDMISPSQPNTPRMARLLHNHYGGHSHVDVCLYMILDRVKPVDIEYLRSIHHLCNIIPVLVKTDLLSRDQEYALKCNVLQELGNNGISIYGCGHTLEQLSELCRQGLPDIPPFSISTKLVNPGTISNQHHYSAIGYSKLIHLKDVLFYTHVDQLRQSTVCKFMAWRREQTSIQQYYRTHRDHWASSTLSTTLSPPTPVTSTSALKDTHHLPDLENTATKLTSREIAERIQDLTLKQKRSIHLHLANYVNEQRQDLEHQKNKQLARLRRTYQTMEQQEKIKFLTGELNAVLSDLGFLAPGPQNILSDSTTLAGQKEASNSTGQLQIMKTGNMVLFDRPSWFTIILVAVFCALGPCIFGVFNEKTSI
ncbi:Septin-domain-containing protein [Chlamydoabsidia padenii]|nr:Septin-domain-containing protein [Chlamydoabsidia padenii]